MFKNLTRKGLFDKRWFMLGWTLGVATMIILTVAFFPTIKDQIGQLLENVPKSLQAIIGDSSAYSTISGYVANGVFDLRVPLLLLPMAIILAVSLSVGEEASGQLYQLLAQPISRVRIVAEKWLTLLIVTLVIHLGAFISVAGIVAAIHEHMPLSQLIGVVVMSWLLCLAAGSLVLMLGFATGRKGLTILIGTLLIFGSYLLTSLATQVSWLQKPDYASLFHYYHVADVVKTGLSATHVAVLALTPLVCLVVAIAGFANRDIGTKS